MTQKKRYCDAVQSALTENVDLNGAASLSCANGLLDNQMDI